VQTDFDFRLTVLVLQASESGKISFRSKN
jgi:hypothetical protein